LTIRDELDAITAGTSRALAEQDAMRFASYYTDDARLLSHGQPARCGSGAGASRFLTERLVLTERSVLIGLVTCFDTQDGIPAVAPAASRR
jgi:hypothetical protein